MKNIISKVLAALTLLVVFNLTTSCDELEESLPQTVENVDVSQYLGLWYEIASITKPFTKNCLCTTAEYSLNEEGNLNVFNRCVLKTLDGELNEIEGQATIVPNSGNAKLLVSFFGNIKSPYWIVDLAPDYSWAVVSEPFRNSLWILSRTPTMDQDLYDGILVDLKERRYPIGRLKITSQECVD